ncbi:MAG: DNA-directed RNA polymerase subunit omega [Firmicutes bacterium]|nr:DNA-directed RNA polymerase subunit omega [Bacillota bacterium]
MLYPSINELLEKVDSRYTLVMLVSKRARQLVEGDEPGVEVRTTKSVTTALEEFYEEKLEYTKPDIKSLK